jgi:cell division protein FtsI/penicillin-binding protein 2
MTEAMKTVVEPATALASKAALEHYTVAGKTGTAQKVVNGTYVRGKYLLLLCRLPARPMTRNCASRS